MTEKRVRIEKGLAKNLQLFDKKGREITNPTVAQFREAIVGVAKDSGSNVISMTVHGVFISILMAGDDEVPDDKAIDYANGLVTVAEEFLKLAKEAKTMAVVGGLTGGRGGTA